MPYTPSFGTIQDAGEPLEAPKAESPFRIAFMADLSGRQNRGQTGASTDIAARKLLRVSRDTLDDVMAKLGVQLTLPVGDNGAPVTLSFASLDDFHPDQLHDKIDPVLDAYESDEKSAAMNRVLHHPDFQALESAWRGLAWLLSRAAKGGQVEVLLLDVSLAELAADLKSSDNLTATGLHQILIEKGVRGPQGEPWAVLVGNYIFDLSGQHAELLGRLAKIALQTKAPFLTTVHPQVLDKSFTMNPDAAPAWQMLRQLPESGVLGLAVPRFLLRLPYGDNTQTIDKFSYEEMPGTPDRKNYLWGNPALACAALIAQAFQKDGWACQPGAILGLEDLPIHVYTVDGDQEVTLAEAWLVRPQTEQLVKLGLMPFLCVKGKGAMQLLRFLSLVQPPKDEAPYDLYGRWSQTDIVVAPKPTAPRPATVGLTGKVPTEYELREANLAAAVAQAPPPKAPPPRMAPLAGPAAAKAPPAAAPPAPPRPAAAAPAAKPPPKPAAGAPKPAAAAPAAKPTPRPAAPAAPAASAAKPPAPPAQAEPPPAEEEELDPELAALLKQLE